MAKKKLVRFREMEGFGHVVQPKTEEVLHKDHSLKGKWAEEVFGNDHPITLELGCGKGEYTIGLARKYPDRNFIGVDIKGARIWRGAKTAREESLENVFFLRTSIDFITAFFAPGEVQEIWITFPDPQPAKPRKRLTSPLFLGRYVQFLKEGGLLHLKSDSRELHDYTKLESLPAFNQSRPSPFEQVIATDDLYGDSGAKLPLEVREWMEIKTFYETRWLAEGKKITYLQYLHK